MNASVEAVGSVSGDGIIHGTTTTGILPRAMPGPQAFDYYLAHGTVIDVADLGTWAGVPDLRHTLLSPSNNPFGTGETNPEGIYIIDLAGQSIWIQECRFELLIKPWNILIQSSTA